MMGGQPMHKSAASLWVGQQRGFALAIILISLFLIGIIGAYIARTNKNTDVGEVQNKAAIVTDVVSSITQIKNVVDYCVANAPSEWPTALPDGAGGTTDMNTFSNVTTRLVPKYPFAVDPPSNPGVAACSIRGLGNSGSAWVRPTWWSWPGNICCVKNDGARTAYNPWAELDIVPPVLKNSGLFANPAQDNSQDRPSPGWTWLGVYTPLPAGVTWLTYPNADGQVVVFYNNNKNSMNTTSTSASSGAALIVRPFGNQTLGGLEKEKSMQALMASISDRLNRSGLESYHCNTYPGDSYMYNAVVVRLYRQPGTRVNPCPSSPDTTTVP